MAAAGPGYKYIDIYIFFVRRGRPAVICSSGAQTVAPNKLLCFHNSAAETQVFRGSACLFRGCWANDAAPSCLECFHNDTVLHHARTHSCAQRGETLAHQVYAKRRILAFVESPKRAVTNVLDLTVGRNYDVNKFWYWFVTCSQTEELYIERLRVCSKVHTLRVKMCFLSREFDVVCHFGL